MITEYFIKPTLLFQQSMKEGKFILSTIRSTDIGNPQVGGEGIWRLIALIQIVVSSLSHLICTLQPEASMLVH